MKKELEQLKAKILPKSWDESDPHGKLYSEIDRIFNEEIDKHDYNRIEEAILCLAEAIEEGSWQGTCSRIRDILYPKLN